MARLKIAAAITAAAFVAATFSVPAEANRRCGYDRYGYHPPSHRGCGHVRQGWGFYPAYGFYWEGSYYAIPRYRPYYLVPYGYPIPYGCYYDNGYDLRVHLVCPRPW